MYHCTQSRQRTIGDGQADAAASFVVGAEEGCKRTGLAFHFGEKVDLLGVRMRFRVWGLRFGVGGLGFGVGDLGLGVGGWGLGFGGWGLGLVLYTSAP